MGDRSDKEPTTAKPNQETPSKRRKVRKGTRSCWECKRRKIRCIFTSSEDATCIGCQRRRVPCVSQDMPEDLSPGRNTNRNLGERIAKVEDYMRGLLAAKPVGAASQIEEEPQPKRRLSRGSPASSMRAPPTPADTLAAEYPIVDLPGPNTHPVILAKLMLIFAITIGSPSGEKLHGLSEPPGVLMHRLVTAATTWVTNKQEMHGTVESLICIILEGVIEVNCGNLRPAWGVYRRALTVAQLMGLHRTPMPPLRRIDPKLKADPKFLWFRIVYMDRYLSLLLGLPQGTSDNAMGNSAVLQHEPPLGRFERSLTVVASRILERNERAFTTSEITTTHSIDSELLNISKSLPASFWRPANFYNLTPGSPDTLLETIRLSAQVYYYSLLIQLHLPFMMHGTGKTTEQEYSRLTCINASREIIARFIAHRSFNHMSSCSRPVDFFALLAAMTLLLAHIDTHHHRDAINFLAHQRLSDRAMLDQALDRMDAISGMNKDEMTGKSARLIRRLLAVEADAAEGSNYTVRSVGGNDEDVQDAAEKDGEELRLHIPYLGVIRIARQGPISREPWLGTNERSPAECAPPLAIAGKSVPPPPHALHVPTAQEQPLVVDRLGATAPSSTFSRVIPSSERPNVLIQDTGYEELSMLQYRDTGKDDEVTLQSRDELPSVAAGIDDWTFQGVDVAFFDSLISGTSCLDAAGLEQ
ncbi:hypothetical protein VPNG_09492 [Cytospora leucostoma]|uniref:Zn(2)-C6 fungal-type domain-containing protein n=1 Tax=Cytospora leucostoma TaxID=1230097 RepID=A0A423VVL4_9PEZI|nr:hypothetical protein VPNG_09492 [Cytospora leucostoma]